MCNINALISLAQIQKKDAYKVMLFMQNVSATSYATNNDGDGVSVNNRIFKDVRKLDYTKLRKHVIGTNDILSHQRLSTHGHSAEYTQPFINDEFILMHNGIMSNYAEGKYSDTYGFLLKLTERFKEVMREDNDRESAFKKTIKELSADMDRGSYSIIVKDIHNGNIYYMRNTPQISFYFNDKYLFITTNDRNKIHFENFTQEDIKSYEIKPYVLYCLRGIIPFRIETLNEMPYISTYKNTYPTFKHTYRNGVHYYEADKDISENVQREKEKELKAIRSEKARTLFKLENEVMSQLPEFYRRDKTALECYQCKTNLTTMRTLDTNIAICGDCASGENCTRSDFY